MCVMERVESTESWAYCAILGESCALWTELKVQGAGRIVVYRVIFVGYAMS